MLHELSGREGWLTLVRYALAAIAAVMAVLSAFALSEPSWVGGYIMAAITVALGLIAVRWSARSGRGHQHLTGVYGKRAD